MNKIEFKDVRKAYGQHVVLDHFNLCIEEGEFVTMIGSSGCGKTTALKLVNGLLKPDAGTIYIDGEDIWTKDLEIEEERLGMRFKEVYCFLI